MSFHTLGVGRGFYLFYSQQTKQCKGLCITSAYHPSPSKDELPAIAAPCLVQKSIWHRSTQSTWAGQHTVTKTGKVPGLGNLQTRKDHFWFPLLPFFLSQSTSVCLSYFCHIPLSQARLPALPPSAVLPLTCLVTSPSLPGQVEEWWGGGCRHLWRFSSHNMGMLQLIRAAPCGHQQSQMKYSGAQQVK